MKKIFTMVALLGALGTQSVLADKVIQNGVVYDKMSDGACLVVGWDNNSMPEDKVLTIAKTVTIDSEELTVSGIIGGEDYTDYQVVHWDTSQTGDWRGAFCGCTTIKGLKFEEGSAVTWIGDHAFKGCSNLATAEFPSTIKTIKSWCFEGTALENVDLSSTQIETMTDGCFYSNKNLVSVTLPSGLVNFWDKAFKDCSALTSVKMPTTVKNIYNRVFEGCSSLETVELNDNLGYLGDHVFKDCTKLSTINFPSKLSTVKEYAFESCTSLTSVILPASLTDLENGVFYSCSGLSNVVLPYTLTNIGEKAFNNCTSLVSINLPSSLSKIGNHAFDNTGLTSVVIPSNVNSVDYNCFENCNSLATAVVNSAAFLDYWSFKNVRDIYLTSNDNTFDYPFDGENAPTVHGTPALISDILTKDKFNGTSDRVSTTFPLTLAHGYATFSSNYNLDLTACEGLTAYKGRYDAGRDCVVFSPVTKIQKGKGVLLKGTEGATYTAQILDADAEVDDFTDNELVDAVDPAWITDTKGEDGVASCFIFYENAFHPIAQPGYIPAGKAYLYIKGGRNCDTAAQAALAMYFEDGEVTGITSAAATTSVANGAYYNLCGQKVERPQHGVFIHNGKKVVLK